MNQSVEVHSTITLSWIVTFTTQENRQSPRILLKRYPQHNSLAEETVGLLGVQNIEYALFPSIVSPLQPRIFVLISTSVSEPALTLSDATKQDEAFYQIEVEVGWTCSSQPHNILDGFS